MTDHETATFETRGCQQDGLVQSSDLRCGPRELDRIFLGDAAAVDGRAVLGAQQSVQTAL